MKVGSLWMYSLSPENNQEYPEARFRDVAVCHALGPKLYKEFVDFRRRNGASSIHEHSPFANLVVYEDGKVVFRLQEYKLTRTDGSDIYTSHEWPTKNRPLADHAERYERAFSFYSLILFKRGMREDILRGWEVDDVWNHRPIEDALVQFDPRFAGVDDSLSDEEILRRIRAGEV